ncbi:hypothetical protein Gotri_007565 [Gossypium trilobum]|uniref:Uncharacterized protein n=1 Tax=Gossypium trilobum TaxID=34281 RepID=A0A7J9EGE7_9ROSI|nr:hypothetical protein [Gossypium trilobum]
MIPNEILYQCGDFNWAPLFRIWGATRYVSLLVLRQYRSRHFIPATQGLAQCEFAYKGDNYNKKVREISVKKSMTMSLCQVKKAPSQ